MNLYLIIALASQLRPSYADLVETKTRRYLQSNDRDDFQEDIFEGDIRPLCSQIIENYGMDEVADLVEAGILDESCLDERRNLAIMKTGSLWNNRRNSDSVCEVPFQFDSSFADSNKKKVVRDALRDLAKETGVLKFVESNLKPYINVKKSGGGCWSYVGRTATEGQSLSLGYTDTSSCASKGVTQHEFMHALGFWHEQARADRDTYVEIHEENIRDGSAHAFNKQTNVNSRGVAYDYGSVMHYPSKAFSKNGEATITAKQSGKTIGQRNAASHDDIIQLRLLYQCKSGPRTLAEYNKNPCTNDCKCWPGATGCGNNDNACQGHLVCSNNKCVNSNPTASPTPEPKEPCEKITFQSGYGKCSVYAPGQKNHNYCTLDKDKSTGILAINACSECGHCTHDDTAPKPKPKPNPTPSPMSKPPPTPSPTKKVTEEGDQCVTMKPSFHSKWGDCSTYVKGKENHKFCGNDKDQNNPNIIAEEACSECGKCSTNGGPDPPKPTPPPTPPPTPSPTSKKVVPDEGDECVTMKSSFHSNWGDCSTYVKGKVNHNYCDQDQDKNNPNIIAEKACSECGKCSTNGGPDPPKPTPSPPKPTSSPTKAPTKIGNFCTKCCDCKSFIDKFNENDKDKNLSACKSKCQQSYGWKNKNANKICKKACVQHFKKGKSPGVACKKAGWCGTTI